MAGLVPHKGVTAVGGFEMALRLELLARQQKRRDLDKMTFTAVKNLLKELEQARVQKAECETPEERSEAIEKAKKGFKQLCEDANFEKPENNEDDAFDEFMDEEE